MNDQTVALTSMLIELALEFLFDNVLSILLNVSCIYPDGESFLWIGNEKWDGRRDGVNGLSFIGSKVQFVNKLFFDMTLKYQIKHYHVV